MEDKIRHLLFPQKTDFSWPVLNVAKQKGKRNSTSVFQFSVTDGQGRRNRGGRGAPGPPPPRIEHLKSKIFENSQNVIFLIIPGPP